MDKQSKPTIFVWQWGRLGAGPRYGYELAQGLRGCGDCKVFLSLSRQSEVFLGGVDRSQVDLPVSTFTNNSNWEILSRSLRLGKVLQQVEDFVRETTPDVAICAMPGFWDLGVTRRLVRLGIPVITIVHEAKGHPGDWFKPLYVLQKHQIMNSTGIATLTDFVATDLRAKGLLTNQVHRTIAHIPFLFDDLKIPVASQPGYPTRLPLRLLLAGRLQAYKGAGLLTKTLQKLDDQPLEVRVIGRGSDRDFEKLGIIKNVDFRLGWCSETQLIEHIDWADVVLAPYIEASQSGIVSLAHDRGRPVVATRVGGLPEQVSHEQTGLVADRLTPDCFAATLRRFIDDPELFQDCAKNIVEDVRQSKSWEQIAPQFSDLARSMPSSPFRDEKVLILQRDIFTDQLFVKRLFRQVEHGNASDLASPGELRKYLTSKAIDRVVFSNPYRHEHITQIYKFCHDNDFPLLVIERGCFPETVFLDMGGFLVDSSSYLKKYWDIQPTHTQQQQLVRYLSIYNKGMQALEVQSDRGGGAFILQSVAGSNKPVVLITLQMPSDTVTNVFVEEGRDYDSFIELMSSLVDKLGDQYLFVYKPHPRTPDLSIMGAISLADVHIDEAIIACDAVITFNSGTGVLAFLHEKPVAIYGRAFYGVDGLVSKISNLVDLEYFLRNLHTSFDVALRERFLIHLLTRILSDVRFLSLPFWKRGIAVAIQYRVARIFDRSTAQTRIFQIGQQKGHMSKKHRTVSDFFWAIKRWLKNRLD
ncbi:MAG: glycosyltransferase [bacterium]|nr:glycosyltransferase [bacterium]